jgi:hypothetical protein
MWLQNSQNSLGDFFAEKAGVLREVERATPNAPTLANIVGDPEP